MKLPARVLLAGLLLWGAFAWPLPRHLLTGIPSSARNVEKDHVRTMIPGDSLQLLYHFWLAGDMLTGGTPPMRNVYEFNTGDDAARFKPGAYYMPFPILYLAGSAMGGRAFGWNLTGAVSIALTVLFTFLLLRRHVRDLWMAVLGALLAAALPYRWHALLGGSPTGFALMWPPLLFLGLDIALRDGRPRGGAIAGAALLLACMSDLHTFYFAALAAPAWCLLMLVARPDFAWRRADAWTGLLRGMGPAAPFALAAAGLAVWAGGKLRDSGAAGGRGIAEIAQYAPTADGLLGWCAPTPAAQVFVGRGMIVLLAAGWIWMAWGCRDADRGGRRSWRVLTLLLAGSAVVVAIALGPFGPFEGRFLLACRKLLPHFDHIRQTGKIFVLMPTFLAFAAALVLDRLPAAGGASGVWRRGAAAALAAVLLIEYRAQVSPTICRLAPGQEAYAAVAADAAAAGRTPHALAAALWPGDAHWSSLHQYYASLYRIRMMNGYSPVVPARYLDGVYPRFRKVNTGDLTDADLTELASSGIRHILLHEDMFPESVSPYPVAFTLKRLLNHPRLEPVAQDRAVWAFRILDAPAVRDPVVQDWTTFFPARRWEFEATASGNAPHVEDPQASGGAFARLEPGARVAADPVELPGVPDQRWILRVRGHGVIAGRSGSGDGTGVAIPLAVDSDEWIWIDLPLPDSDGLRSAGFELEAVRGRIDADTALLVCGPWRSPPRDGEIRIPAPVFFHAGFTDLATGRVELRRDWDPDAVVFYGPGLPLDRGRYEMEFRFSTPAPAGTRLGRLNIRQRGDEEGGMMDVTAGTAARVVLDQEQNLPVMLAFHYLRNADMSIGEVIIRRIE